MTNWPSEQDGVQPLKQPECIIISGDGKFTSTFERTLCLHGYRQSRMTIQTISAEVGAIRKLVHVREYLNERPILTPKKLPARDNTRILDVLTRTTYSSHRCVPTASSMLLADILPSGSKAGVRKKYSRSSYIKVNPKEQQPFLEGKT